MHLMAQLIRRERLRQVEHDCLEGGPIIGMDPFDQGAMCKSSAIKPSWLVNV